MKDLHCPNPSCTNTFSAAEVQAAGIVQCPRCRQEFRFKPPALPPIPIGKPVRDLLDNPIRRPPPEPQLAPVIPRPVSKPEAPPRAAPIARPVAPPTPYLPLALPVGPGALPPVATPQEAIASGKIEKIVRVRGLVLPRRRQALLKLGVVALVVGAFLAAVLILIYTLEPYLQSGGDSNPSQHAGVAFYVRGQRGVEEKVMTLRIDKAAWSPDKELKSRMKALAAYKRADADADTWIAVAVQDFGVRLPREGELLSGAIDRLRAQFGDSLQLNTKFEAATIAGIEASRCLFEGRINVVVWRGECVLVPYHGFAYWFFVASPIEGRAQELLAELDEQRAFVFTTERRGWTELGPEFDVFTAQGSAFELHTPRGVWRKNDPKTEDENGVLYLAGFFQSLQNQSAEFVTAKNATVVAVALDKNGDLRAAFKDVVAYFERKKKEESKDYRFEPVNEFPSFNADAAELGDQLGALGEFKLKRGDEAMRYVVLAAFNDHANTYGMRFECAWENRSIWRKEFQELLKTVRRGQK